MADEPQHIELSSRAERDLRRLQQRERERVFDALDGLVTEPPPENLDVKQLAGHPGWLRLRVGDFRVLYRPLTEREQSQLALERGTLEVSPSFFVARVVNRRELERAVRTLEVPEVD